MVFPDEARQKKREGSYEPSFSLCSQGIAVCPVSETIYCPEFEVLADVAPAAFGMLRYPVAVFFETLLITSSSAARLPPVCKKFGSFTERFFFSKLLSSASTLMVYWFFLMLVSLSSTWIEPTFWAPAFRVTVNSK